LLSFFFVTLAASLLATSRADLSSRPILTISRGPVFVPIIEGSEWYKTEILGANRLGFRYIPAGINPAGYATPCRTIESNPTSYRVSWEDRSPFLKVSKDGLCILGSKGFRSARCNAPIREGKWYMEVKILHGGGEKVGEESRREGGHVRLGWGRREAPLNAPVGLDGYSYGYRDKTGEKVALSRPRPYGQPFGTGDVVGLYISLPQRQKPIMKDPHDPAHLKRERIPIDLRGQEVFEILEYQASKEMIALMDYSGKTTNTGSVPSTTTKKSANGKLPERGGPATSSTKVNSTNLRPLPILHGSRIAFFLNGKCQGTAFQDLYDYLPLRQTEMQRKANSKKRTREGVKEHRQNPFDDGTLGYYPFISLFNDAAVKLNPGPHFDFPPPDDIDQLLNRMTGEEEPSFSGEHESSHHLGSWGEMDVKPERPNGGYPVSDAIPRLEPTQHRKWRPAIDRYPEFMQEEWEFDALEEQEAKLELERLTKLEVAEEEKRKQKEKKKKQAEARKRSRKEAADRIAKEVEEDEDREKSGPSGVEKDGFPLEKKGRYSPSNPLGLLGPGMPGPLFFPSHIHSAASPSPLRHSTSAYVRQEDQLLNGDDHDVLLEVAESDAHSPAPTFASYGDFTGGHSGYTSENNPEKLPEHDHETDNDNEMDVDHELEAMIS